MPYRTIPFGARGDSYLSATEYIVLYNVSSSLIFLNSSLDHVSPIDGRLLHSGLAQLPGNP